MRRTGLTLIGCLAILVQAASAQQPLPPIPPAIPESSAPPTFDPPAAVPLENSTAPGQATTLQPPAMPPVTQGYPGIAPQGAFTAPQGMPSLPAPGIPQTQAFHPYGYYGGMPSVPQQQPHYWRVGTRHCGQTFAEGICDCKLSVSACGPDGRWRPSTEGEMMAAVQQGGPICLMAHGSLVDESGSRLDSTGTYRWLRSAAPNMPLHVIFFDWPSQRCIGPHAAVQFLKLGRQAARNGFVMAKLVQRLPADSPVCLMGHSHGARLVCAATHLMGGGEVQGRSLAQPDRHHRLRLVLAAAAIDHHWLNPGERYCRTVTRAESIVSIENAKDFALLLYPLQRPFGAAALGQKGLWKSDERALGHNRRKIYHLDVTSLIGKGHVWPFYYTKGQIARSIAPSVFFPDLMPAPAVQYGYGVPQVPLMGSVPVQQYR